jgi:DNA-binding CsgD family transcriptional regulator
MADHQLRPIELTVQRLRSEGLSHAEVGWRLRRSPGYVRRVETMSEIGPRPLRRTVETSLASLRPIERCVLKLLEEGSGYAEIASRLRRTPEFVARVERLAGLRTP